MLILNTWVDEQMSRWTDEQMSIRADELILMLMQWPQAVTVTHVAAYHRPSDCHFSICATPCHRYRECWRRSTAIYLSFLILTVSSLHMWLCTVHPPSFPLHCLSEDFSAVFSSIHLILILTFPHSAVIPSIKTGLCCRETFSPL